MPGQSNPTERAHSDTPALALYGLYPFSEFTFDGLRWLEANATGPACFIGPDDRQYTAVPVKIPQPLDYIRFNLIDPKVFEMQYLQIGLFE